MSGETNVNVKMEEEPKEKGLAQRGREWIGGKIAGSDATERMQDTWNRIHRVGGFLPIFVEGRLELRTKKQQAILNEIDKDMAKANTPAKQKRVMFKSNRKVFTLFHTTGSQFMEGLTHTHFAKKIRAYLELYQRIWDKESFTMDLFTCSMAMLNYSWKPRDVASVPPYLVETKTVIQPTQHRGMDPNELKLQSY